MKKLTIATIAATVAGAAFAELGGGIGYATQETASAGLGGPLVYEYKAAVKNMYLKLLPNVKWNNGTYSVYMKYQRSTALKGWLIMDQGGVTSPTIMSAALDTYGYGGTGFDYGRNRGFLVVINPNAPKVTRRPKIMPAVLDAKWIDTAFAKEHQANTGLAEGYLYLGGDAIRPVRPQLDVIKPTPTEFTANGVTERQYDDENQSIDNAPNVPSGIAEIPDGQADAGNLIWRPIPGMVAIADYVWTSVHLFSAGNNSKEWFVNGPNWFTKFGEGKASVFGSFEYFWDQELPEVLRTGWHNVGGNDYAKYRVINYYHDTWMNGSGFGKWTRDKAGIGDYCCGWVATILPEDRVLESLSGSVKGGIFLCTENGIDAKGTDYAWFDGDAWEDQFNTTRIAAGGFKFAGDAWQNDLWQDGFFEVETTDIITGNWSIKLATSKFFAEKNGIAKLVDEDTVKLIEKFTSGGLPAEITKKVPDLDADGNVQYEDDGVTIKTKDANFNNGSFAMNDTLWSALNGAALNLAKTAGGKVTLFDGSEIFDKTIQQHYDGDLPMITPRFAIYYRLVYGTAYEEVENP